MVYINIKDAMPVAYIPLNGWSGELAGATLKARNTTDRNEVVLRIDTATRRGFLACLVLWPSDGLYPGEWEYTFAVGSEHIASGLLGAYDGEQPGAVQYESANNVIQYGGD